MKHIHVIQKVIEIIDEDIKVIQKVEIAKIIKNDPFSRYPLKPPKNALRVQNDPPITKGTPPPVHAKCANF